MKQYKNLTLAHVAALVEAGEAAHDLACIDKRGGIAALQNDLSAAEEVQDVLDSVNGKRFVLVLNELTAYGNGIEKVAKAAHGDTGNRSPAGETLRYRMQTVGTGNVAYVEYYAGGWYIRDTLSESAASFAGTLALLLVTVDAEKAAAKAAQNAQSLASFAANRGAARCE